MASDPITFVIPGQPAAGLRGGPGSGALPASGLPGHVKASVRVAVRRAGGEAVRIQAVPGEDVVVLHLQGGPQLVLHPENARDLLMGQGERTRAAGTPNEVTVPSQLRWRSLEHAAPARTRGFLGDVLLSAVEVLTGFARGPAADRAAQALMQKVDGQVQAGVYALNADELRPLKDHGRRLDAVPASDEPMLVFLHGTFVDTASTFAKLWALHPGAVRRLFAGYGDRVYALDHPTLGASPIANALILAQALPAGARLHLATHSRGGLVAEVLARVAALGGALPADELAPFAGTEYAGQRRELKALAAEVQAKGLKVERVLRVACPARGTLLASHRLDAYLSVLKWGLELASVPVAPALLEFLAEVARRRADPMALPGLAAMVPDSPLVQWLNRAAPTGDGAIDGDLRVVAGDLEGDSMGSWVKTLLADAFYWTDNDIVVQTRSMYGGSPRRAGASFLLDQGGKVTHFNYFANERTVSAIVNGLLQDRPSGFRPIGPLSWSGTDSSGLRGIRQPRADRLPADQRPAVFVLPGILGSHLRDGDKRIWLSLRLIGGLGRLAWRGDQDKDVHPDGPIGLFYDDLIEFLDASHEVIPFAFDWRRPIEQEALRLSEALARALDARDASRQPVRLLAHSMGGVLARTVQLVAPEVWDRLMARDGARLLMLGTPNGGSWAPMQVLSGDDGFGNTLAAFGAPFQDHKARQLMAEMPGFIQLQAGLLEPEQKLATTGAWQALADRDLAVVREANWWHTMVDADNGSMQLNPYRWGVPPQPVLNAAVALRRRLDRQQEEDLPRFANRLLLVTGRADFTPDGFEWTPEGLAYRNAADGGDGRVPLDSALLPGVRTWTLDCDHGALPDAERAFGAYVELLERGDTDKLPRLGGAVSRGSGDTAGGVTRAPVLARPSRGRMPGAAQPAESMKALLGTADLSAAAAAVAASASAQTSTALKIRVVNGDLTFVQEALLIGHYRSTSLTGTERVIDRMLGGAMHASMQAGLYPDGAGMHQVFMNTSAVPDNPWRAPRPEAAIVIGLGDEGLLKPVELTRSVRQAVLAWCQRLAERPGGIQAGIGVASTLIGSGGLGVSSGDAAGAIARGVREAADVIRHANAARREALGDAAMEWPVVTQLTFVELYLERASEAWRGLKVQATATPGHYDIAPTIISGVGPLRRQIDTAYRGAAYDLISAECTDPQEGVIAFRLDTRRARTEVRAVATQARLVRDLVKRAATDTLDDPQVGRTLFQLLVPLEMEAYLGGTDRMVLELDEHTAPMPWELLDPPVDRRAGGDPRPWAIRTRLMRKLRKRNFRPRVQDATADDAVLIVGEPKLYDDRYGSLPGALEEARRVRDALAGPRGVEPTRVRLLEQGEASAILNALFERPWRIVHIAGHGEPGGQGGLVMSGGTFLGPREIAQMRTVPELVFVNCCHLAARAEGADGVRRDPAMFAASVADALIEIGVRCVVAAGWAVEDEPAALFAATLYRELLAGRSFIQAVAQAREDAWRHGQGGNTWAAYQCYGDPDWVFTGHTRDAQAFRGDTLLEEYESIASPLGLALALEQVAVESRWQGCKLSEQLERVRHLEARFGAQWGTMGAVAEAFGLAYKESRDTERAIGWYERAVRAGDGSASMKAPEQWLNLRVRRALDEALAADTDAARRDARQRIDEALQEMQSLARLQPTVERLSLCGSAWKRLALLEAAGDGERARHARQQASDCYAAAERLAIDTNDAELYYPSMNRMSSALAAYDGSTPWAGFDPTIVARARECLLQRITHDPDFWSMVGSVEIDVYEAVAQRAMATVLPDLLARVNDLQRRAPAPHQWASVADNAAFALGGWSTGASAAERQAIQTWLARLRSFAAAG